VKHFSMTQSSLRSLLQFAVKIPFHSFFVSTVTYISRTMVGSIIGLIKQHNQSAHAYTYTHEM